jgi:hypothetical protein
MSQAAPAYRPNSLSSDVDDLVTKLGQAFARLDAKLLKANDGQFSDRGLATIQRNWWRVVEKAAATPSTSRDAWRAKASMLSAVVRDTEPDHPIAKMAQSLIRDIITPA